MKIPSIWRSVFIAFIPGAIIALLLLTGNTSPSSLGDTEVLNLGDVVAGTDYTLFHSHKDVLLKDSNGTLHTLKKYGGTKIGDTVYWYSREFRCDDETFTCEKNAIALSHASTSEWNSWSFWQIVIPTIFIGVVFYVGELVMSFMTRNRYR